jgi:hypothetical protein
MLFIKHGVLALGLAFASFAASAQLGLHAPIAFMGDTVAVSASSANGSRKPRKAAKARKSKAAGVTFHNGSAESTSERDRRLTRECKGRSNSGVCEGYTR